MSSADVIAKRLGNALKDKPKRMERVVNQGQRIAMQEAPVKRGTLRRSHTTRVENGGNRGRIGVGGMAKKYAQAVHDGYPARVIRPRVKQALMWRGARHPVKSVQHPGYKGNPWFERTARRLRPIAAQEFGRDVFAGVR